MCSGRDSDQTCEIWGRSDHVEWSYKDFLFHGEGSKFAMSPWRPPRSPRITDVKAFDNFLSSRYCGDSQWIWSRYDEISRTSSLKYEVWKWRKWRQNGKFNSKWPTSCWSYGMGPWDFFVCLVKIHTPTKFGAFMSMWTEGPNFCNFLGGAIEPFFQSQFRLP